MSWIKRNLFFFTGSIVAVALMVAGVLYLLSKISEEQSVTEELTKQYDELKRLAGQNPHPGDPGKIDNVKAAKTQESATRAYVVKAVSHFQRPTPVPDSPKVGGAEFATQLPNVIAELTHEAQQSSVGLPAGYYFSFEAQKTLMTFDPASLNKLAVSLGDIKALCELLFGAKINYLESVKREVVSTNDTVPTDYISLNTTSNALAELTPYELSFHCFSGELAATLAALVNSPYCIIVKAMNVEPAPALPGDEAMGAVNNTPVVAVQQYQPQRRGDNAADTYYKNRYSTGPVAPMPAPQPAFQPPAGAPVAPKNAAFLTEHQLRVSLQVLIVKLKPQK